MKRLNYFCLKTLRWTSWPLLIVILCFLLTGYLITGDFGLGRLVDEKQALALHKLLHLPLLALLLVHVLPAIYLALRRWGWIGHGAPPDK
jgi:hypothetical protein